MLFQSAEPATAYAPRRASLCDRTRRHRIDDLRLAIDCLPVAHARGDARRASATSEIIVGAYVRPRGRRLPDARRPPLRRAHDFLSFAQRVGPLRRAPSAHARATGARARRARGAARRPRASPSAATPTSAARSPSTRRSRASASARRGAAPRASGWLRRRDDARDEGSRALERSPGRTNMISGTTHAGATAGAESAPTRRCPRDGSSPRRRPASLTKSVIGVSTNAGHSAVDLMPSLAELLVHRLR